MLLRTAFAIMAVAGALFIAQHAQAQSCPNGGKWCGPGRGCCPVGTRCAPSGGCMKPGYSDCGPGRGLCEPGLRCAPVNGCIPR